MQKLYSIYDDNAKLFMATSGGKVWLVSPRGVFGTKIGQWSLPKARNMIKDHKRLQWRYPRIYYENGNPTRKALRLLRVYSKEWSELTGIVIAKMGVTVSSYEYYYR